MHGLKYKWSPLQIRNVVGPIVFAKVASTLAKCLPVLRIEENKSFVSGQVKCE